MPLPAGDDRYLPCSCAIINHSSYEAIGYVLLREWVCTASCRMARIILQATPSSSPLPYSHPFPAIQVWYTLVQSRNRSCESVSAREAKSRVLLVDDETAITANLAPFASAPGSTSPWLRTARKPCSR